MRTFTAAEGSDQLIGAFGSTEILPEMKLWTVGGIFSVVPTRELPQYRSSDGSILTAQASIPPARL